MIVKNSITNVPHYIIINAAKEVQKTLDPLKNLNELIDKTVAEFTKIKNEYTASTSTLGAGTIKVIEEFDKCCKTTNTGFNTPPTNSDSHIAKLLKTTTTPATPPATGTIISLVNEYSFDKFTNRDYYVVFLDKLNRLVLDTQNVKNSIEGNPNKYIDERVYTLLNQFREFADGKFLMSYRGVITDVEVSRHIYKKSATS